MQGYKITGHCHQSSSITSRAHTDLKMTVTWAINSCLLFIFQKQISHLLKMRKKYASLKTTELTLDTAVLHNWHHNGINHHFGRVRKIKNKAQLMSASCEQPSPLRHTDLQAAAAMEIMKAARHTLVAHNLLSGCSSQGPPHG